MCGRLVEQSIEALLLVFVEYAENPSFACFRYIGALFVKILIVLGIVIERATDCLFLSGR